MQAATLTKNKTIITYAHLIIIFFWGMYNLFQPIYLYQSGVPILWVIGYQVLLWTISLLTIIPTLLGIARLGIKTSILSSWILRLIVFAYLASITFLLETFSLIVVLTILAAIDRIASLNYWLSFHSLFAYMFDGTDEGASLGRVEAFNRISAIIAPLTGALLLSTLSPFWFFGVISLGFTCGVIGYLFVQLPEKEFLKDKIYPRKILGKISSKESMPYFTEGIIDRAQAFMWPILLMLKDISLAVMGALFTITNLIRATICVTIGKILDHHKAWTRLIQSLGMAIMSLSLIVRSFFFNIFFGGVGQAMGGIGQTIFTMPTVASMYDKADTHDATTEIAVREMTLSAGRLSASLLVFILTLATNPLFSMSLGLIMVALWCAYRSYQLYKN